MPVLASTSLPSVPLALLSVPEQLQWIELAREQLLQKQARERTYLDRRAARGTHTPTDDAYEADQLLENHLLEALDLLRDCLSDVPAANMSSPNNTLLLQLAPPDYPQPKP